MGKYEDFYLNVPAGSYSFEYKGESFSSDKNGTIYHKFNNQENSFLTVGQMPSEEKTVRTGYYGKSYKGHFLVLLNKNSYDAIQVMFDTENALKFRKAVEELFLK